MRHLRQIGPRDGGRVWMVEMNWREKRGSYGLSAHGFMIHSQR